MADNTVTFLTEIEVPPYCFMSEAIEWIAFGRVPQMQHEFDEKSNKASDCRFSWREMPDNFQPSTEYPWFDRLEFEDLGIPIDESYFDAAQKCYIDDIDRLPKLIKEYEGREEIYVERDDGSKQMVYETILRDYRHKLEESGPLLALVNRIEDSFRPHFEIACAKMFQLVALGQITAQALDMERWERLTNEDRRESAAQFEDVPPRSFFLGMDWMSNEILVDGKRFVALRVKVTDVLENREILLKTAKSVQVERFGAFYSSTNLPQSNLRRNVGRRPLLDWSILKDHLRNLALGGTLPDRKESCIYEIIVYAERELGRTPSRTAVQRNMGYELDAHYARN